MIIRSGKSKKTNLPKLENAIFRILLSPEMSENFTHNLK